MKDPVAEGVWRLLEDCISTQRTNWRLASTPSHGVKPLETGSSILFAKGNRHIKETLVSNYQDLYLFDLEGWRQNQ